MTLRLILLARALSMLLMLLRVLNWKRRLTCLLTRVWASATGVASGGG